MGKESLLKLRDDHPIKEVIINGQNIRQADFGEGHLGFLAWSLIVSGVDCQVCGSPAAGTTDFDIFGDATIIPHCSENCHKIIRARVCDDYRKSTGCELTTVFSKNGLGRA